MLHENRDLFMSRSEPTTMKTLRAHGAWCGVVASVGADFAQALYNPIQGALV
jgi:hypothetical protein